jgi:hypothetical protein
MQPCTSRIYLCVKTDRDFLASSTENGVDAKLGRASRAEQLESSLSLRNDLGMVSELLLVVREVNEAIRLQEEIVACKTKVVGLECYVICSAIR